MLSTLHLRMFNILAESPSMTSGNEWLPILVSLITAVLTVGTSYFINRRKQKTTDFEVIIDERKEFTEEIRKELKRKQQEHEEEIADYERKNKALRDELAEKSANVLSLQSEIAALNKKAEEITHH